MAFCRRGSYFRAMKPRRLNDIERDPIALHIASLGREGEGLAVHEGKRIYVPGALTGEDVLAIPTDQIDRDVLRATLTDVLFSAPDRVQPPCAHYSACGGCALQHLAIPAYRSWKKGTVHEHLARAKIAPVVWDAPLFIDAATRRRASFAVVKRNGRVHSGFHGHRSHRMAEIERCLLMRPKLSAALSGAKPWLARLLREGQAGSLFIQEVSGAVEVVLTGPLERTHRPAEQAEVFSEWASASGLSRIAWRPQARVEPETMIAFRPLVARFGGLDVPLPPGAFLQPSFEGELALSETVLAYLADAALPKGAAIADLFAGCGTFSGPLLERGPVHAVEMAASPVAALKAAKAGPRLTIEQRNLFTRPLLTSELKRFNAVVLDPPRAGAEAQAQALAGSGVQVVVYVSCNPAALAKDAATLMRAGFAFRRARLVDQFIWSAHSELVALFSR
jgi:23S rRNA (uracil1939-C5)-methyltransferase